MNSSIEKLISDIYKIVYKKTFTRANLAKLLSNDKQDILNALSNVESSQAYMNLANKLSVTLAKKGVRGKKGVWRKYYENAKKSHYIALPKTWNEFEAKVMTEAISHNFKMISSIPQRMKEVLHHKYTSTLIEEVAKGNLPRGSFRNMLASHGHKQAQLIARTETAKLQTAVLRQRATSLGSIAYIWMSSRDKRTRPSHRMMNGVIVFWRPDSEKPKLDNMQGDAGEFPNCRCDAEPIVDINDLNKNTYKVYNYNTHSIITMTKKELIKVLQNGAL